VPNQQPGGRIRLASPIFLATVEVESQTLTVGFREALALDRA